MTVVGRGKGRAKQNPGACTLDWPEMLRTDIQTGLSKYGKEPRGGGLSVWISTDFSLHSHPPPPPPFCKLHAAFASWKPQPLRCSHLSPIGIQARVAPVTSRPWLSPTGHRTAGILPFTILVKRRLCNNPHAAPSTVLWVNET